MIPDNIGAEEVAGRRIPSLGERQWTCLQTTVVVGAAAVYQSESHLLYRSKTVSPTRQSLLVLRVSKILAEEAINNGACFSEVLLSSCEP